MGIQQLRNKLISNIQQANETELKSMLKIYQIATQSIDEDVTWKNLSENNKSKIDNGLQQLKQGKGIPATKVLLRLNKKYGIA